QRRSRRGRWSAATSTPGADPDSPAASTASPARGRVPASSRKAGTVWKESISRGCGTASRQGIQPARGRRGRGARVPLRLRGTNPKATARERLASTGARVSTSLLLRSPYEPDRSGDDDVQGATSRP